MLETIVLPNFSHVALMGVGMVCWAMSDEKRRAAVLYPFWWAYRAIATPSWESEGLERQRYWLVFLSNAVLPPWNSVGILAALTIGDTAAISWVSGPMMPVALSEASSLRTAGTASASSHCLSSWLRSSCLPRTPPFLLMTCWATCEPCSMAWPRTARGPVKQERTPKETCPALSVVMLPADPPLEVLVLPQAATSRAATVPVSRRRPLRLCRARPGKRDMAGGVTVHPPSAAR